MGFIPAALAAAACVALGMGASRRLSLREKILSQWDAALLRMKGALDRGESLNHVLREGKGEPTVDALSQRMAESPALPPEQLLRDLPWNDALSSPEREALGECLLALFSPSLSQQAEALAYARAQWSPFPLKARAAREKDGKLYVSLGWLAGAALFILLC